MNGTKALTKQELEQRLERKDQKEKRERRKIKSFVSQAAGAAVGVGVSGGLSLLLRKFPKLRTVMRGKGEEGFSRDAKGVPTRLLWGLPLLAGGLAGGSESILAESVRVAGVLETSKGIDVLIDRIDVTPSS